MFPDQLFELDLKNISTAHADVEGMEFWRMDSQLNYMPEGLQPRVMVVRYFDIHEQKRNNAEHIIGTLVKLYKDKMFDMGIQVFYNEANADGERDMAIIWYHDSWSSMDRERNSWTHYEEMFKMDSREFFENWNDVTDLKGMEIFTLAADLSAATGFSNN